MKHLLTKKQQTVFEFIQRYFQDYRRSPLIREIQLGCQIASYKSAIDRLNALERKRFIRRLPNKHRGIKLLRRAAGTSATPVDSSGQPISEEPSLHAAGEGPQTDGAVS